MPNDPYTMTPEQIYLRKETGEALEAGLKKCSPRDQLSFVKPQSREKEMFRRFPPALTTGRADGEVMMATGTRE